PGAGRRAGRDRRSHRPHPAVPGDRVMRLEKQRPGDDCVVHDESADPVDRASALMRLACDGRRDLIPLARRWLGHHDPLLRAEAVNLLLSFWGLDQDVPAALVLLRDDRDPSVRSMAARSLCTYVRYSEALHDDILRALV